MRTRLQRGFDRLSLYLPVLLMGLLALGSWWLVRTAPQPERSAPVALAADQPDYRLRQFHIHSFGLDGQWRSSLSGSSAAHYPQGEQGDELVIEQVQGRSLNRQNQLTTLSAQRGHSRDNASSVTLEGDALVQRYPAAALTQSSLPAPELVLRSQVLHAWPEQERVHSDQPVTIEQGLHRLQGQRLDYDHQRQVLELHGQVKTQWQARQAQP
ncbi:MAG: LPS export ABC transporter periplasmic protein LptC [Comamonas sp.]|nr:LPS export ABC transporter periplasmic protein LptC [Comamonas sp.]